MSFGGVGQDMRFFTQRRHFSDLSEREAGPCIFSEEDDARIYQTFAAHLSADYPASAAIFEDMAKEENTHRQRLLDLFQARFGDHIPLIRREHVAGFYRVAFVWLSKTLSLRKALKRP